MTVAKSKLFHSIIVGVLKYFLGLIIAYLVIPCTVLSMLPILLYRRFLFHAAKFLRPDLGKMVNAKGTVAAMDDVTVNPRGMLIITIVLDGCPSREVVYSRLAELLKSTDQHSGELAYPELSQKLEKWMGYWFWKPIPDFNLENSIVFHGEEISYTVDQLIEIAKADSYIPVQKNTPLWRISIFPNIIPSESDPYLKKDTKYSMFMMCGHHALLDGFSFKNLLYKMCQVSSYEKPCKVKEPKNCLEKLTMPIKLMLKVPYDLGSFCSSMPLTNTLWPEIRNHCKDIKITEKNINCVPNPQEFRVSGCISDAFPFSRVKDIRAKHKVSAFAVIIAAITGSLHCEMFKNSSKNQIPKEVNVLTPIPLSKHPDKLRNHMTGVFFGLPVRESDPLKRLHKIENRLQQLKSSTIPILLHYGGILLGSLPPWLIKVLVKGTRHRNYIVLSSFPFSDVELKMYRDFTVKQIKWATSMIKGSKILGANLGTYSGFGSVGFGADPSVLPTDDDARDLVNGFFKQLDILENLVTETV